MAKRKKATTPTGRKTTQVTRKMITEQVARLGYFDGTYIPDGDTRQPLERHLQKMLECHLRDHPDSVVTEILAKQIDKALKGDHRATELLLDRAYGKAVQKTIDVTPPATVIRHNVISIDEVQEQLSFKSPEQEQLSFKNPEQDPENDEP